MWGRARCSTAWSGRSSPSSAPTPQTTRGSSRGVITRPDAQVALLDTPGLHTAKGGLNARMVQQALQTLSDADLAAFLIEAGPPSIDPATPHAARPGNGRQTHKRLGV